MFTHHFLTKSIIYIYIMYNIFYLLIFFPSVPIIRWTLIYYITLYLNENCFRQLFIRAAEVYFLVRAPSIRKIDAIFYKFDVYLCTYIYYFFSYQLCETKRLVRVYLKYCIFLKRLLSVFILYTVGGQVFIQLDYRNNYFLILKIYTSKKVFKNGLFMFIYLNIVTLKCVLFGTGKLQYLLLYYYIYRYTSFCSVRDLITS